MKVEYWYLLPALGLVSAIGLSANLKSNQQIPVSVFAVLSYLEPTLLFFNCDILAQHTSFPFRLLYLCTDLDQFDFAWHKWLKDKTSLKLTAL